MLHGADEIRPFEVMEAFVEAEKLQRSGKDVVHLSLGQPGGRLPERVKAKLADAIQNEALGYTNACGMPELREKISEDYKKRYGLVVPMERIFITVGSSSGFLLSILSALEKGSKVAIGRPYYPAYPNMLRALHMQPHIIETKPEEKFHLSWERISEGGDLPKAVIVASPSNPTGMMLSAEEMEELTRQCNAHHVRLFSDEIYHGIAFEKKPVTALQYSNEAIVINSFSKTYMLPGWRLGWVVMPPSLARRFELLAQSFFISASAAAQVAALAMMDEDEAMEKEITLYHKNRDALAAGLRDAGITDFHVPEGAFYLYADVSKLSNDSKDFCRRMLHEAGVCAVPGIDFDEANGHRYVRFSYCGSERDIAEASKRLKAWLSTK